MTVRERKTEFFKLLLERSREREIPWEKTSRPDRFQASFAKYSILAINIPPIARVNLLDENGEIIDTFSVDDAGSNAAELQELYELARRKALGADQALNEVIELLRSSDPRIAKK